MHITINIEEIIKSASTVPTGDNCQPFFYQYNAEKEILLVFHNPSVAAHVLNPHSSSSFISSGMLLFLIELAAKKQGYTIQVTQRLENITQMTAPLFEIIFHANNENIYSKNLFEVIFLRRTHRSHYRPLSEDQSFQVNQIIHKIKSSFIDSTKR